MEKFCGKILFIKTGKIALQQHHEKSFETAINKHPVSFAQLLKNGFLEDEQADEKHHGGIDKALLLLSSNSYEKINKLTNLNFEVNGVSHFGENIVLSNFDEENSCVGDILKINNCLIEISQPREPCFKLAANTKNNDMTKLIHKTGLTGFYARVLQEGMIYQNDSVQLEGRSFPSLTISKLNKLLSEKCEDEEFLKKALDCDKLGSAFKSSVNKCYSKSIS